MKNIIVDVDGTIANQDKRVHFLNQEPKDWKSYFDACDTDTPIQPIIDLVIILEKNFNIIFCTGRTEDVREKTEKWLAKHIYGSAYHQVLFDSDNLLMRKSGDFRHDKLIKPELLLEHNISLDSVAYVLEDRNTMVKAWRDLGLTVLHVADGDF